MKKYIHKDFDHYYRVFDEDPYGYMAECIYKTENTRQEFTKAEHSKFIKTLERAGWNVA
jgi:hypothetical protein